MSIVNPELCKEWDYDKNGNLKPQNISFGSSLRVYWKCQKEHSWKAIIGNRTRLRAGCPFCSGKLVSEENSLAIKNPNLSKLWHPSKNKGLTPKMVTWKSGLMVWWKCNICKNEWQAKISDKNKCGGCPYCTGQKVHINNCLATRNPELAKEWHPTKNDKLTTCDVTNKSSKKVWWKCYKCNHEWVAAIYNRERTLCPKCSLNERFLKTEESIFYTRPDLLLYWDYKKNTIDPKTISEKSPKSVAFRCKKNHMWTAKIKKITQKIKRVTDDNFCPICNTSSKAFKLPLFYRSVFRNSPFLLKEWDFKKNKVSPKNIGIFSHKKVHWICQHCSFRWKMSIKDRYMKVYGCPNCSGKIVLKNNAICGSYAEAYYYLLLKNNKINFKHQKRYGKGMGRSTCDFYIKEYNMYIEVTSYNKNFKYWFRYLRKIIKKKHFVEKNGGNFVFLNYEPSNWQKQQVRENLFN